MKIWKLDNYDNFFEKIIHVSEEQLKEHIKQVNKRKYYANYFEKEKKKGKRKIYVVDKNNNLYKIQKNLVNNFFNNIMLTDSCYGFKKGYNYFDFLEKHIYFLQPRIYLKLDISDFFGSITTELLKNTFEYYISENISTKEKDKLLKYIINIITYNGKIIQGAITSPVVSNIIFRQLDCRIEKYCFKLDVQYTRYADDLLFSSESSVVHSKRFFNAIQKILLSKNFNLNYSKTLRQDKYISVNGYVIGGNLHISRKKLTNLSRILFFLSNIDFKNEELIKNLNDKLKLEQGDESIRFDGKYSLINYLNGNRAFLLQFLKYSDNQYHYSKIHKIIERIEKIVLEF